ncbi:hypothetical protein [Salinicola rhizosphaerae]|nr:hypothetical protein [Salinicola rhizosphaerae]GHB25778.1 hypothetical protein GCM10009038_26110 [Salinicola rhizosphaerae]
MKITQEVRERFGTAASNEKEEGLKAQAQRFQNEGGELYREV